MDILSLVLLYVTCFPVSRAGVTEIPPDSPDDEVVIETLSDGTWIPSNIFDVTINSKHANTKSSVGLKPTTTNANEIENNLSNPDLQWDTNSVPLFRAIRDFIFQGGEEILQPEERNEDPTEEIVKIIEKGLIEATTMFFTSSDAEELTSSEQPPAEPISIIKIENESPDSLLDRIGLNIMDLSNSRQVSSVTNTTTACSNCFNTLQMCVHKCFTEHNCNDVQRQARICPPPTGRICSIFTQWSPIDECKVHEDCKSPLLCCNDGCINKCSSGVWRN